MVQCVVHYAGVHEVVEDEASDAVEGCEEVFVCVAGNPETAAVVAEEVVFKGDVFSLGGCGGGHETGNVDVEPGVVAAAEGLDLRVWGRAIC